MRDEFLGLETYDTTLIHVQPESHLSVVYERARAGTETRRVSYRDVVVGDRHRSRELEAGIQVR